MGDRQAALNPKPSAQQTAASQEAEAMPAGTARMTAFKGEQQRSRGAAGPAVWMHRARWGKGRPGDGGGWGMGAQCHP